MHRRAIDPFEVVFRRKYVYNHGSDHDDVIEVRILLDEHYTGMKEYLEALGWDVTTAQDANLRGAKDREVIEYARVQDMLVVTGDDKSAQIADLLGVRCVWVSPGVIAKAIDAEIREKYPES